MIGLTGGIGSGKSTVAALLVAKGAVVVDADLIARQVVEPGSPVLAKLADRFGAEIIGPDGRLDRAALAARAFVDDESTKALADITHPAIGEEFLRQVAAAPEDAVVVHDVPLLVESKNPAQYRGVIVVEAPRALRLSRLETRGVPVADAESRMAQQATDEERRAIATWVIDNSGDLAELENQVDALWPSLIEFAGEGEECGGAQEAAAPVQGEPARLTQVGIETVWGRVRAHAGEPFTLVRGARFEYEMFDNYLRPVGRVRGLSRSNFAKALARVPFQNTRDISDLQGASYVFAILMDERIRRGDW
jgi:dephospho-CoA kinase